MPIIEGDASRRHVRVAVVVSRFNDFITDPLLAGARRALDDAGIPEPHVTVLRVPGAFEVPMAAQRAAETGRFAAVVCLGCLIKGATPHFDYIAAAVSHGLQAVARTTRVPVTFGVLTTNSAEEAIERAGPGLDNKGYEAAAAALEMAAVFAALDNEDAV